MVVFPPKHASEVRTLQFDFSSLLSTGETISSALVGPLLYSGTDPAPTTIISGSTTISGALVSQSVIAGVLGCVYELVCQAITSLGQTLQLVGMLAITEPPAPLVGGRAGSSIQSGTL